MQGFALKHLGHIRHRALKGWLNVGKDIAIIFCVVCGWNIMTPFSIYSVYLSLPTAGILIMFSHDVRLLPPPLSSMCILLNLFFATSTRCSNITQPNTRFPFQVKDSFQILSKAITYIIISNSIYLMIVEVCADAKKHRWNKIRSASGFRCESRLRERNREYSATTVRRESNYWRAECLRVFEKAADTRQISQYEIFSSTCKQTSASCEGKFW